MRAVESNNQKSKGGCSNLIALGGLIIAALTFYFTFFRKTDETKAVSSIPLTEVSSGRTLEKSDSKSFQSRPTDKPVEISESDLYRSETPKSKVNDMTKVGNLVFQLKESRQYGQIVRLIFMVESEDKDVDLRIYGANNSRIIDAATGKEFHPSIITIADKSGIQPQKILIEGHPIKLIIDFEKINTTIETISKLEILINQGIGDMKVEFRDIVVN